MAKNYMPLFAVLLVAALLVIAGNSPNHAQENPDDIADGVEYMILQFANSNESSVEGHTRRLNELAENGWRYSFKVTENTVDVGTGRTRTQTSIAFERPSSAEAAADGVEYMVRQFANSNESSVEGHTRRLNELAEDGWRYSFKVTENTVDVGIGRTRTQTSIAFERPSS